MIFNPMHSPAQHSMSVTKTTQFKHIALGHNFEFAPSTDGFFNDRNIYQKTSSRGYVRLDSTGGKIAPSYRIGSINAAVIESTKTFLRV